jgi:hypothetical protein
MKYLDDPNSELLLYNNMLDDSDSLTLFIYSKYLCEIEIGDEKNRTNFAKTIQYTYV